ncbi:MAG: [protein-PII] uridylyltransferase [Gammaproteobacteria bacterium]
MNAEAAAQSHGESLASLMPSIRERLQTLGETQALAFREGTPAHQLVVERCTVIDNLLQDMWHSHGLSNVPDLSLVAVGGYGRGELHPQSDVDVLILGSEAALAAGGIESFITALWDTGLDIGHAVRTVAQCAEDAREDVTIATNMVEARLITGDELQYLDMREATAVDRIWPSDNFFAAKWKEQIERHHRYHDTAFNLEPNVKEGPGGLRDLQMIGWVTKRHFGARTLRDLVDHGFLTEDEHASLVECQHYLWQVRFALHIHAGRKEDRLLFDHQRSVAALLGFDSPHGNDAIEACMQRYYRTIRTLSRLNEMLLSLFNEVILLGDEEATIEPLSRRFQVCNGYLEVIDPALFERYPYALLEMFLVLQQNPHIKGVRATTIRSVRENLHRIDHTFRKDVRARSLFIEIMRQPRGITHELQRMHDYGVLATYIREFGSVVGRMQYDLFHAYTVDQHSLFVVRNLRCFFVPERFHEFPRCSALVNRLPKPELLYLGGLFHDMAKGQEGDHSEVGAEMAHEFCIRHGMSKFDAGVVSWLVKNHLLMSATAQRKDISDPDEVLDFAGKVGDRMHLDYLYLLTVADIRATNPTLWNDWKDSLLWDLYQATVRVLRRGAEKRIDPQHQLRDTQNGARRLIGNAIPTSRTRTLWRSMGEDYFLRATADDVAWHTRAILDAGIEDLPVVAVRRGRNGIEIFIYSPDKHDRFVTCTAQLDRLGLSILDARIITADNGMTLDSFVAAESRQATEFNEHRREEIQTKLRDSLRRTRRAMPTTARMPKRQLKNFSTPTRIQFHDEAKRRYTVLELTTQDQPGLLANVGWALAACHVSLRGAKISTFGERAEDFFYISDKTGDPLEEQQCKELGDLIQKVLAPR